MDSGYGMVVCDRGERVEFRIVMLIGGWKVGQPLGVTEMGNGKVQKS